MAETNRAAFLESEKGQFVVRDAPIWEPGENEVLVKVHTCAIQPADAKVAHQAILPMTYPTILGSPISGTVQALGPNVSKVAVGDRVTSGTRVLALKKPMYGGLQRFCVVSEFEIVEIGPEVEFARAVTLSSYTPPGALFSPHPGLGLHRPTIPASSSLLPESEAGKKILIWGGSSAMGALSISYAKAAGYTVITTCSPHNFSLVKSLGADHVFDYHDEDAVVEGIRAMLPIAYWFDTIGLPASMQAILRILAPDGEQGEVTKGDILTLLPPKGPGMPTLPEGVTARMHMFSTFAEKNQEWREWCLGKGGFLEKGIKSGVIRGVPAEVVGGLEKVEEGVKRAYQGVSGRKIVVEPWA